MDFKRRLSCFYHVLRPSVCRLDDEEMERDIEFGITKMRYEIRRKKEKELMDKVEIERVEETSAKRVKLDEDANNAERNVSNKEKEKIILLRMYVKSKYLTLLKKSLTTQKG